MCCIFENVYVGSLDDACNNSFKTKHNISHILTLDIRPLALQVIDSATYLYVHLLDTEDSDLLTHLPQCLNFIHEGRTKGRILVHCHAGQSRSGAVIVAFLMKHLTLSIDEALNYAQKMKPDICPNHGFIGQLDLFEKMNYQLDDNNSEYRSFKLKILSENIRNAHNSTQFIESYFNQSTTTPDDKTTFKCKKCRFALFTQKSVVTHDKNTTKLHAFKHKGYHSNSSVYGNSNADLCSTCIFIEPVHWMKGFLHELSGKLLCPKCSTKIGFWDWSGSQCACGKWQTPSFQVSFSKVDPVSVLMPSTVTQAKPTKSNYVFKE